MVNVCEQIKLRLSECPPCVTVAVMGESEQCNWEIECPIFLFARGGFCKGKSKPNISCFSSKSVGAMTNVP